MARHAASMPTSRTVLILHSSEANLLKTVQSCVAGGYLLSTVCWPIIYTLKETIGSTSLVELSSLGP